MDGQYYVIEIEGFIDNSKRLIPKEIAIVSIYNEYMDHWILEAPYFYHCLRKSARDENHCITMSEHGLKWEDGDVPYSWMYQRLNHIFRTARRVYVYGHMQFEFLRDITDCELVNLSGYPTLLTEMPDVKESCIQHGVQLKGNYQCALNKALRVKNLIHHIWSSNHDSDDSPIYENLPRRHPKPTVGKNKRLKESLIYENLPQHRRDPVTKEYKCWEEESPIYENIPRRHHKLVTTQITKEEVQQKEKGRREEELRQEEIIRREEEREEKELREEEAREEERKAVEAMEIALHNQEKNSNKSNKNHGILLTLLTFGLINLRK